jgi:glutamate N-acetyltransferase/amino-acid N-acetyltransferase
MATMLGFLITEASSNSDLQEQLQAIADRSFHRTTVDGDTSPNDTLFALAGGTGKASTTECQTKMLSVATDLAMQLAADGEGATRLVTIQVRGANSEADACLVGRVIATSPLVKTAIAGRDPNWGRILSAAGRARVPFSTDQARVWIGDTEVFTKGVPQPHREDVASKYLKDSERVVIGIDLGAGDNQADIWTCDLTADYIRINADYRT